MPKGRYVAFIRNASGRIVYHTPEFKTRAEALARAIKRYPKEALIYTVRDQTEDVKAHPRKMVATYSKIFGNPKDDTIISERAALRVLMTKGNYSEDQARIILGHSRKVSYDGADYYPMSYIYKRAKGVTKKNPPRGSSARTRTSTDASVRSPTRTSTSTHAYTRGNITVTGGAGAGSTTVNLPGAKKNARRAVLIWDGRKWVKDISNVTETKFPRKAPKRKARANSKSASAKRKSVRGNPGRAGKWVIRAQTASGVSKRPFFWTGTSFSDQPAKRKKFASIATARERAALILPQLPLEIRAIAIEPA